MVAKSLAISQAQVSQLMLKMVSKAGQKRRFLAFGLLNIAITNGLLQLLLANNLATGLATLLSQLLNVGLGYVLYGTQVFRVERLGQRSAAAYGLLALLLWWGNWAGITGLAQLGWPRSASALALIPVLAACSYLAQKQLVFAKSQRNPTPPLP
jgi:putative flippase GtrA